MTAKPTRYDAMLSSTTRDLPKHREHAIRAIERAESSGIPRSQHTPRRRGAAAAGWGDNLARADHVAAAPVRPAARSGGTHALL